MRALLKRGLPAGFRAWLRGIRKFCRYRWRRLRIMLPVARRQPLRVILGAAETSQPGWYSTNECWLDITDAAHWRRVFRGRALITHAVAEHVFEHLTRDEALRALRLLAAHMVAGGRVRIAVPDGYHPDPEYRKQVGIGGLGDDAADHKQFFEVDTLSALLAEAGFSATQIEGYDKDGQLVLRAWQAEHGLIRRSRQNPDANAGWDFPDAGTSLIVDGIKSRDGVNIAERPAI